MSTPTVWKDPQEQAVLATVSLDAPWALVEKFSTLVRDSGGKGERRAIEYIMKRLSRWGVPHTLHEPESLVSIPKKAKLEVVSPEARALAAKTPSMSLSTDGRARRGLLVYVPPQPGGAIIGLFEPQRDIAQDVAGRIVLTDGYPSPAKVIEFQEKGAMGAVFISPGERIHEGICTSIWGSPDLDTIRRKPRIPVVAINKTEGAWLRGLVQAGPVKIRLSTKLDEGWRPIPVLVAEIPGRDEPEKFVLLHGHIDSWHEGVGDNATGDATLLEAARVLWAHRDLLRRSVRIAWWSGHSHGRYAGSTWYADTYALDLDENCIVHINCDSPGCRWASVYEDVFWMSEAEAIAREVIRDVTGQEAAGGRPLRAGDKSFSNIGISTFYMLSSTMPQALVQEKGYYPVGGCGGNIAWHTEDDRLEIADRDNLLRDMKVYVAAAFRAANSPLYPLDFRATAAEFGRTLARYQEAAGAHFDFSPAIAEVEALADHLGRFYDTLAALAGRPLTDPQVRRANDVLRRLGRVLVPINYTRAGRFRHDPAVNIPALPDLEPALRLAQAPPGGDLYRLTRIHLTRGQNRVVAALREARRLLQEARL
ncbi:MAG: M28 family peptidase [Armatimonadota bacterium]|nr:M28 family peptidase [Armatimonadota bacterium]MDR7450712.1 M28 family peptidase [Armatimonadota bacterium]MDR7466068.1 M28 family peptidase [Armatimonadota bacterium]MDR7493895.1 M28 family peptidase [Armatimonadota bacterium]MDR7504000.1 M28 family peptidase [Armatimonadota bacterium]